MYLDLQFVYERQWEQRQGEIAEGVDRYWSLSTVKRVKLAGIVPPFA